MALLAGRLDEAGTAYERAVALAPRYVAPRFNLGLVAVGRKQLDAARGHFEAVLAEDPAHGDAKKMLERMGPAK